MSSRPGFLTDLTYLRRFICCDAQDQDEMLAAARLTQWPRRFLSVYFLSMSPGTHFLSSAGSVGEYRIAKKPSPGNGAHPVVFAGRRLWGRCKGQSCRRRSAPACRVNRATGVTVAVWHNRTRSWFIERQRPRKFAADIGRAAEPESLHLRRATGVGLVRQHTLCCRRYGEAMPGFTNSNP